MADRMGRRSSGAARRTALAMGVTAHAVVLLAAAALLLLPRRAALAADALPARQGTVTDLADLLTPDEEAQLAVTIDQGVGTGRVVLNVLTIGSMSDYAAGTTDVEAFTRKVFDTWTIGDAATNNGALLLVARNDRKARIELGAGFAHRFDAEMNATMTEAILPRFKQDRYGKGILDGAQRIVKVLTAPTGGAAAPPGDVDGSASGEPVAASQPSAGSGAGGSEGGGAAGWVGLGVIGAAAAGGGGLVVRARRPRKCTQCGATCRLLNEQDDDVLLDDGQRCEEYLRSVNYVVWKCPTCSHASIERHKRLFTRRKTCGRCGYRTVSSSQQTLSAATYSSSGDALVTTVCAYGQCGNRTERHVTLPRLTHTSSSSSSSGSSHSFSSGGGGHSGGGGSSGSW